MGVKLDYTIETVTDVYQVTYVQTSAWDGRAFDTAPKIMHVIAPSEKAARHFADEINHHGDLFAIMEVAKLASAQLAYESYLSEPGTEGHYVVFGGTQVGGDAVRSTPKQWKGPFKWHHNAVSYAATINKAHGPRVCTWYDEAEEAELLQPWVD